MRVVDFLLAGRKFDFRTAVNDGGFGPQPQGRASCIHGHIAATDHDGLLASMDRREIVVSVGLHEVVPGQELVGGEDAVGILARDAHEAGQTGARADENGFEAFFVHQGIDGDGAADDDVQFNLDTQRLDSFNLGGYDLILRKTELGNAVFQHASGPVEGFENGDIIAQFGEVGSTGQSGRTGADDGDFVPVRCCDDCCRGLTRFAGPVGDEAFEFADGDTFALDAEDAAAFTLRLLRADTSADGGQRRIFCDDRSGSGEVAVLDFFDEFRNLDADGTGAHAARILAMQAAGSLQHRFFDIVSVADLFEIGRPDFRILLPYRNSSYFVCHSFLSSTDSTYMILARLGFLCAILALTAHGFVEIDVIAVEFGAFDAGEAGLAGHGDAAGAAHARSVHH